jgi:hypothetical protein
VAFDAPSPTYTSVLPNLVLIGRGDARIDQHTALGTPIAPPHSLAPSQNLKVIQAEQ